MTLSINRTDEVFTVAVEGPGSIRFVAEAREALLSALAERQPAAVDLSEATGIDAAWVQLLASARASFAAESLAFDVVDPQDRILEAFAGS